MLEGIGQLRKEIQLLKEYNDIDTDELEKTADAIEREVESKYNELLPKDVSGKTVRYGCYVTVCPYDGKPMKVNALRLSGFGWSVVFEDGSSEYLYRVLVCEPPTVEDVLEEALNKAANLDRKEGYWPSAADITNIVNEIAPKLQLKEEE